MATLSIRQMLRRRFVVLVLGVVAIVAFALTSTSRNTIHSNTASPAQLSTTQHAPLTATQASSSSAPISTAIDHEMKLVSYATVCKTINVKNAFWWAPYTLTYGLYVPICYNGSQVWVNGHISPWVWSIGWATNTTWYGYYNDSSHAWLGVGQNISATWLRWTISFTLLPRWYINANGQIYQYVNS